MAKRILVADDSATMQRAFGMVFAGSEFTLVSARSVDEAVSAARHGRPDLVIADVVLGNGNGYDLCAALKADPGLRNVPVVILASNQNPYDETRAHRVGAAGALSKPFDSQALAEQLTSYLSRAEGKSAASASAAVQPSVGRDLTERVDAGEPVDDEDDYGEFTIERPAGGSGAAPMPARPLASPPRPATVTPVAAPPVRTVQGPVPAPALRPSLIPGVRPAAPVPPRQPFSPAAERAPVERAAPPAPFPAALERPSPFAPAVERPSSPFAPAAERPSPFAPAAERPAPFPSPPERAAPFPSPVERAPAPPERQPVAPPERPIFPAPPNPAPVSTARAPATRTMTGLPAVAPPVPARTTSISSPMPRAPSAALPLVGPAVVPPPVAPSGHPTPTAPFPLVASPAASAAVSSAVAQKVAALAARGPEYEAIAKLSREIIEQVVWEVVPELAEVIIRQEVERLASGKR